MESKINYRTTTRDGKTRQWSRLIWEEHNGKIPEGFIIHHKNGDNSNDRIENLRCISRSEHTKIHNKLKQESLE